MASMDIGLELALGREASSEIVVTVEFCVTYGGCPANMGSLRYPGHPAEPMEIEIETIFWPVTRFDKDRREWVDDHIEMPASGLSVTVMDAVYAYIVEHYEHYEQPEDGDA